MPLWTAHSPQDIDDTQYNTLCWSCHNDVDAPYVRTHSSLQTDNGYGNWTVECRACHNPHFQKQFRMYGSASYLYSGASTGVTTTTVTKSGAGWTDDEYQGLVVFPNVSQKNYNYKILSNTSDTLTVQGPINLSKAAIGNTFAIVYGKLVYDTIDLSKITITPAKSGSKPVRFYNSTGTNSFADGDSTYDGICEVCHTQTTHFVNDGSGSNQLHTNVGTPAATNCTSCHSHVKGFAHGGSGGGGCDECHGHDAGYDGATGGKGTYVAHSTHTENDSDDVRGPNVGCSTCHNTSSFPNFADGVSYADYKAGTEMTTVCNPCHSPSGTYNGISNAAVGAKNNWSVSGSSTSLIYAADGSLRSGKEKWCATCHDEVPSEIDGVSAPNVIGDEDGSYTYGTGWGFYKTGHGVSTSVILPSSGGVTNGPGKDCGDCHDLSTAHIDGNARTFTYSSGDGSAFYQTGYRLKDISGGYPMHIPPDGTDSYRLCFSCHTNTDQWIGSLTERNGTNFWSGSENDHYKHMRYISSSSSGIHPDYDWDGNFETGNPTCITCHNVHGSTNPAMVRDGSLSGKSGFVTRYGNSCDNSDWAGSEITLAESTILATQKSSFQGLYCATTTCHGTGTGFVTISRNPATVVNRAPELGWVGGLMYESDGVNPDAAPSGSEFTFKVKYSDTNQDPPAWVQLWIDRNGSGTYEDDADPPEKIDMTSAFAALNSCAEYSKGVDYVAYVTLDKRDLISGNTVIYTFRASDQTYGDSAGGLATADSTLTIQNDPPSLDWTGESNYTSDGVNPDYGPQNGTYYFRVKYTDDDGDACPASGSANIQVWIDLNKNGAFDGSEKFNLTEVSAADTDCTAVSGGKLYSVDRILSNSTGSDVAYDYRFYTSDGTDEATGTPVSSGGIVTVAGTANNPPFLAWDTGTCRPKGARPPRSATNSIINFSVRYYDEDNECPTGGTDAIQVYVDLDNSGTYSAGEQINLNAADDGDTDCTTSGGGKLYTIDVTPTTAATGIAYEFHASDGTDEALGDPQTVGGTVDVINATKVVRQDGSEDYTTLSAAISGTSSGATILVYDGTYNENVALSSSRNLYSACGAEETIISSSNDPVVYFNHSYSSVIDGFTVTGSSGSGIYSAGTNFNGSQSTPTIKDCIIRNNGGRGISSYASLVTITGCEIYENTGGGVSSYSTTISDSVIRNNSINGDGGGIYGTNTLNNVIIKDNTATGNGGGIYCYNSSHPSFSYEKVTLTGNTAIGSGGGAYITWCYPTFTNSLVSDNSAPDGGGLSVGSWAGVTLKNSTITNNTATTGNGGACYANGGSFNVANSIVWGNRATSGTGHIAYMTSSGIIYVNIYDSIIENNGDNNIYDDGYYYTPSPTYVRFSSDYIKGNYDSDPNFVNPHADGDYHINDPSDAIDNAANNSGWGIPSDDLEGNSRPSGSEDIGAYEYQDGVSVSFTSSSQTTAGESGTATITVELSEASNKDVTVPFTVNSDSTATGGGTDYSITASPVVITAGETTATITVTIAADSLDENNETVIVDMGAPTNASQGGRTTHTVTITDDDTSPTVTFTSGSQSAGEGSGTTTITAELSTASGRDVTVPFTVNGSSTATDGGTDYSITPSPITITAGDTTASIFVTLASDSLDEDDETVIVDMGTPTGASQGATTSHTITITDDDTTPAVTFTSASQSTGGEPGTATITAELSAVSGRAVTVPFSVNGTSTAADPGDYSITASPLVIAAGDASGVITVTVASDSLDENNETVIVDMGSPTNATQGATTSHTVTITDDDDPPTVTFTSASQATADESGTATITAQISAVSALDVTVPFTVNGSSTAADPDDYSITASPLTITAGNISTVITVTVAADTDLENDETVIVDMGSPANATQGAVTSHTLTITDDEVGNHLPETPTNSSPANGATGVSRTPTLTASAYSDQDSDLHHASQWQISTDTGANFDANIVYDSGPTTDLESHAMASALDIETTFYWHVRYQDDQGNWSSYSSQTSFNTGLPSGAIAYWKFDEGSGTTAFDSIGSYDGTISGATWTTSGKSDDALSFDGSNDYMDAGSNATFENADNHTVEAWVKSSKTGWQFIAGYYKWTPDDYGYALCVLSDGRFGFLEANGGSWDYAKSASTSYAGDNTWHHLVGVRRNGVAYLYVDGVEQPTTTSITPSFSSPKALVGWQGYSGQAFGGTIDEVIIYNRALTADEILNQYNAGGSVNLSGSAPNQPINSSPSNGATGIDPTPTLTASAFSDPDGDSHAASRWQVRLDGSAYGSSTSLDTGEASTDLTSISLESGPTWAASDWSYRRAVGLSPATPSADYPVQVLLTPETFDYSKANADGSDLRFYQNDGTSLDYFIDDWDNTGTSTIYVKVATVSTSTVYMYYGKADADDASTFFTVRDIVDSGFEGITDFTGIWKKKAYYTWPGAYANWNVVVSTTGGNPDQYVSITNNGSNIGTVYVAQEITVPSDMTVASFTINYQLYSGHAAYCGSVAIRVMEKSVWDALAEGAYLYNQPAPTALWAETVQSNSGSDIYSWTSKTTTGSAGLVSALAPYAGQQVMAIVAWGDSGNYSEWGKLDNFSFSYTSTSEPQATLGWQQAYPVFTLDYGSTYYWRVQYKDDTGAWSQPSDETSFTVRDNNAPNTPTASSPSGTTVAGLQPTLTSSAFSDPDAGDTHAASQWQISIGTGGSFAANIIEDSSETSGTLTSYTLTGALNASTTYYWQVRHKDAGGLWSSWSAEANFDTNASFQPDTPSNSSPADGATGESSTPTLTASAYSDPDSDPHQASQWQISTDSGANFDANIVYDSGSITDLESHTVASALDADTTVYWHVRYQDNNGGWSDYSSETSFTTGLPSGAIANWKFDEGSGTTVADSVGSNDGTITGAIWTASGKSDDALSFDNSGDYIHPAGGVGTGLLNGHSAHTIEAWIKWGGSTDRDMIFAEGGTTNGAQIAIHAGSDLVYYSITSSSSLVTVSCAESLIPVGEWVHIAGTYDGAAGTMKLYVNGAEVASRTSGVPASIGDAGNGWRIGGGTESDVYDGGTAYIFNGTIDEVIIYDRALSDSEVLVRYENSL